MAGNHPICRCWRCGLSAYDNIGQNERTPHLSITTYYQHIPVTGQGFGVVLCSLTGSTSGKSKRRVIALLYLVFVLP
jgi:hypothetical protein